MESGVTTTLAALLRRLGLLTLLPYEREALDACLGDTWPKGQAAGPPSPPGSSAPGSLADEHEALFFATRFPALELWESCFLPWHGDSPRLLGRATENVLRVYQDHGLAPDPSFGQPGDHWGFEALFAAHLLEAQSAGTEGDDFLTGHFMPFTEAFTAALADHAALPEFRRLAQIMGAAARSACDIDRVPRQMTTRRTSAITGFVAADSSSWDNEAQLSMNCGLNNGGFRNPIRVRTRNGCLLGVGPGDRSPAGNLLPNITLDFEYHNTFLSGQRLRHPLKRVGARGEGRFTRISWDEAADTIAAEITRIKQQYGPAARYVNYATGLNAVARGNVMAQALLSLDGGHLGSYNSYSAACTAFATRYTYGTAFTGNTPDDYPNSAFILLWGHNPVETGFGTGTAQWLERAHSQGSTVVVIDPRLSDTARRLADRWIPIRPTTDSALADAMAHTIVSEGLQDQDFMDRFCVGFDRDHMPEEYRDEEDYLSYLSGVRDGTPKTPEWAAPITGVPAQTIEWLARSYATQKPAALIQGLGPQRTGNGEQTVRSAMALTCLTGNVGIPGGAAAGIGATRTHRVPGSICARPNPCPAKIPVFLWTRAIAHGTGMTSADDGVRGVDRLDVPIKLILNLAGNTLVNQHSDVNETTRILADEKACEFIVTSDLFMTPSALFSDIVLPGTSIFESQNIGLPWREGNYLISNNKCISPLFESRFEYDWLAEVADRLGIHDEFTDGGKDIIERLRDSYEQNRRAEPDLPDYDSFRAMGLFKYPKTEPYIAFREQIEDPEHHPFPTPSGKIEIFSAALHRLGNPQEIPAIPKYVPSFEGPQDELFERFPFQLIGWHTRRRTHSTLDTSANLERLEPHRLWLNPVDARTLDLHDEDVAEVYNDRGTVRVRVKVTERIIRGVVALAQGAWHRPDAHGVDVRGNPNTLTTQRPTPLAKGNPQHSTLVAIRRVAVSPSSGR